MMKVVVALLFLTAVAFGYVSEHDVALQQDMVEKINAMKTTWQASMDQGGFISKSTVREVKQSLGAFLEGGPILARKTEFEVSPEALPTNFDSRTNWPRCVSIKQIRDQSACGSCWAFGAVEAISDRICIFNKSATFYASDYDMLACCGSCGFGCGGGFPGSAWDYWVSDGLVSESCGPYPFPSCDHHIPDSKNPCPKNEYPTPDCVKKCKNSENWSSSKKFGASSYSITNGATAIQQEIFKNGPVETAFTVYEDFLTYKSGVYQYTSGSALGGHAVKILGWGIESSTPYWLVANSWNPSWGDRGYFKIIRGTDDCGIEDEVWGGVPK